MLSLLRTANRLMAAAGTGDPGSGGPSGAGGSSTPSATTPSVTPGSQQPTPSTPSAPAQPGTGTEPAAATPEEIRQGDWRTLRQKYDDARTKAAFLEKLGMEPTKLEASLKVYTTMRTGAWETAKGLGYEEADFDEAFATNPERTLQILRGQEAEAQRSNQPVRTDDRSLEDKVKALVAAQTQPFNEHINRQMTEQAMTRYTNEFNAAIASNPILKSAPPEVHELVRDYLEENLQHDEAKLVGMKLRGEYGFLRDDITLVANRLQQVFSKWLEKGQAPVDGSQPGIRPATGGGKRPTLDEIIERPEVLGDRYRA